MRHRWIIAWSEKFRCHCCCSLAYKSSYGIWITNNGKKWWPLVVSVRCMYFHGGVLSRGVGSSPKLVSNKICLTAIKFENVLSNEMWHWDSWQTIKQVLPYSLGWYFIGFLEEETSKIIVEQILFRKTDRWRFIISATISTTYIRYLEPP